MPEKKVNKLFCLGAILFFVLGAVSLQAAEKADYFDKSGKQVAGREGQTYNIEFNEAQYSVKIGNIEGDYVDVSVNNEGPTRIREGDTAIFQRTEQGTGISVEVMVISGNYTNLRVRMVEGIKPAEPVVEYPAVIQENLQAIEGGQEAEAKTYSYNKIAAYALIIIGLIVVFFLIRHYAGKRKRPSRQSPQKMAVKKVRK